MTSKRVQIQLQPDVLRWARERAGFSTDEIATKLKLKMERVENWEHSGELSFAQAEKLAHTTHTPLGYLFLASPPVENLPIPDFRTRGSAPLAHPSPDLLETVYLMQRRQEWMRDELIASGYDALEFVGSYNRHSSPENVAEAMRMTLSLDAEWAARKNTWSDALVHLIRTIDASRIMIISNGIVGNNTHRKLDPEEFQGFALVDAHAPLIFVNNADYKTAQMFTVAHELAHIFVGEEGVSVLKQLQPTNHAVEQICNSIAAEFLLPESSLRGFWHEARYTHDPYQLVAQRFKVSTIVAARRAMDIGLITRGTFMEFYGKYLDQEYDASDEKSGGNFWNNQIWRVGPYFGSAVVQAVKEGRILYRDAYDLTGLSRKNFDEYMNKIGG